MLIWEKRAVDAVITSVMTIESEEEGDEAERGDGSEKWVLKHMLRAADVEDIYDLDWSPDGRFLVCGLTDNSAQVWDVLNARLVKSLKDHKHFVQGVSWDPFNQFLMTQSCDR